MTRLLSPTLLGLLSPLLVGQAASAGTYKEVKDVTVQCDTAMRCTLSLSAKSYEGVTSVSLQRDNRLDNALSLKLTSQVPIEDQTKLSLTIDGGKSLSLTAEGPAIKKKGSEFVITNSNVIRWVVSGMKAGNRLTVTQSGGNQSVSSDFSLSGSVAGMIFMDEQQDLLNTPYALKVKGDQQANPRLPINSVSTKKQIPLPIWDDWFREEDATCHFYGSEAALEYGDGFRLTLGEGDLYGLPCGSPGAYNQVYIFFFAPTDPTKDIKQVPFLLDGNNTAGDDGPDIWNINFDAKSRRLTSFMKGRGLSDCGTQSKWDLYAQGPAVFFEAVEIREKGECDGNYAGGPDNWPVSWPVD